MAIAERASTTKGRGPTTSQPGTKLAYQASKLFTRIVEMVRSLYRPLFDQEYWGEVEQFIRKESVP